MVFDSHHKEEVIRLIQKCLGKLSFALKILELRSYKNYSNDNDDDNDDNNDYDI